MLAAICQTPELALSQPEAEQLANGITNVARHYNAGNISTKMVDWGNLVMVCGMVYGPRIVALGAAKKSTSKKDAAPVQDKVVAMKTNSGSPPANPSEPYVDFSTGRVIVPTNYRQ